MTAHSVLIHSVELTYTPNSTVVIPVKHIAGVYHAPSVNFNPDIFKILATHDQIIGDLNVYIDGSTENKREADFNSWFDNSDYQSISDFSTFHSTRAKSTRIGGPDVCLASQNLLDEHNPIVEMTTKLGDHYGLSSTFANLAKPASNNQQSQRKSCYI